MGGKQIFSHGIFSEAEGVDKKKRKKKKKERKKKVGENNGQLCFIRHHGWRTQARLDQNNVFHDVTVIIPVWSALIFYCARKLA